MVGLADIWRRLAGALAALLVGVLALAPALDRAVCGPGESPAIAAHAVEAPSQAEPDLDHRDAAADACVHGHCHHAAYDLPTVAPAAGEGLWTAARPGAPPVAELATETHFGLMRPPRA
jgi:hypothetical protein